MIGFLRLVGLLNAAIWFGAAIFFTFAAAGGIFSEEMKHLLGEKNYPYFSGAIAQILIARYFRLQIICGIVALLHLATEWLYLGRSPRKFSAGLLVALVSASLLAGTWFQPRLKELHTLKYAVNTTAETRKAADQTFKRWHAVSQVVNLLMMIGLAFYLWRVANPPDQTRFLNPAKLRG